MAINFQKNKWRYSTFGLLAVLALGLSFPQASAHVTTSLTHNVQHILNALSALQSDVDGIQSDIDNLETGVSVIESDIVDSLGQKAITVNVFDAEIEPSLDILPLDVENDRMYTGHVNGILTLTAVENTSVQLLCGLHIDGAPILTMVRLDSTTEFQGIKVSEDFTCTTLRLEFIGEHREGILVDLAVSYTQMDGIEEIDQ